MPFDFQDDISRATLCRQCHASGTGCVVDTRVDRIKDRNTEFQLVQQRVVDCALGGFVPGTDSDPSPHRPSIEYRAQAFSNTEQAGRINFEGFKASSQQLAKVHGDIYELMQAAALWNAGAAWNSYMDTGIWNSKAFRCPPDAIPTPTRRVAIVKMARGADTTELLNPSARAAYSAFEVALNKEDMELKLSTPDILGLRIPDPMPDGYKVFLKPLPNLDRSNQEVLETAWQGIRQSLEGRHFMFAVAIKTSARSDRLYQALFEANVLKFIIGYVLRGPAIKFHAHLETFKGSDVVGRYKAAAMTSLLAGGTPSKAIDVLYKATSPNETAQMVLDSLPTFPL